MSLVGNLEDLSLGDIMQIISLSQKFGVLALQSDRGQGRIVFGSGLVRGANLKGIDGHFSDLRDLVVGKGILDPAGFDMCAARADDLGLTIEEMLRSEASLDVERLNTLIRESVEAAVLEMFTWPSGDFSFDVRSEPDDSDPKLLLRVGLNAQYLAMEGMRIRDESVREEPTESASVEPELELSAHDMFGVAGPDADYADGLDDLDVDLADGFDDDFLDAAFGDDEITATEIVVAAVLEHADDARVEPSGESASKPTPSALESTSRVHARPLILIDPDVAVLEWVKTALQTDFQHVHVFQQADQGLMRIRQYLIRGELPVVLISPDSEVDPLSGIRGLSDFVKRLKAQAAKLPVFGLVDPEEQPVNGLPSHLDGVLVRPARGLLDGPESATQTLSVSLAELLRA